jgi:Spy/CpxP family protein refolding chaperone
VNSQTTLKQDRAQFQVWIQKNEKKNFEISIKARATLAQLLVGDSKDERKGM